jgi:hypothetical protein
MRISPDVRSAAIFLPILSCIRKNPFGPVEDPKELLRFRSHIRLDAVKKMIDWQLPDRLVSFSIPPATIV